MIKANDLRHGCWIKTANGYEQVVDVLCDSVNTKTLQNELYDNIEGIELTAELLGKIKNATSSSSEQCLVISLEGVSEKLFYWHYSKKFNMSGGRELIKNELHHLQNYIYANYGTELSITL